MLLATLLRIGPIKVNRVFFNTLNLNVPHFLSVSIFILIFCLSLSLSLLSVCLRLFLYFLSVSILILIFCLSPKEMETHRKSRQRWRQTNVSTLYPKTLNTSALQSQSLEVITIKVSNRAT